MTSPAPARAECSVGASLAIVKQLDDCVTPGALGKRLLELTSRWGVTAIIAGLLPDTFHCRPAKAEKLSIHSCALMLRQASATSLHQPDPHIDLSRPTTHLFLVEENLSERIEGLLFPIVTTAADQCGVAYFGDRLAHDEVAVETLSFIANYAFARMLKTDHPRDYDLKLTRRQSEVLSWAAQGKTDWEIAAILNVSEHTVDKYMRQIRESLNAVNRTTAIVMAMRNGLIS